MWQALLAPLTNIIGNVVKRIVPDKDLALKLQAELTKEMMEVGKTELDGAIKIILAEAQGKSWLQRNWRPILMISIVGIVVNNYIIFPYLHLFGFSVTMLELPNHLYTLMTTGVGGYILGRSGEKMVTEWKK